MYWNSLIHSGTMNGDRSLTSEREVKGTITWKSIGSKLALGKSCAAVRECMDQAQIVSADTSLFDAIGIIAEHDYVLVQTQNLTICGIVTSSDLSLQFKELAEPFLLIGECEYILRRLVHGKFTLEELKNVKNQSDSLREITGVADLTLGEYVRLIENNDHWSKLKLAVDRKLFIENLNKVREIRNAAMHFDPQGVEHESIQMLRDFAGFLRQLWRLGAI